MSWEQPVQYRAIAARSLVIFPCYCWEPTAPGFSMGPPYPLLWSPSSPPPPTHKLLSHCSQRPSISVSGTHGDCGGGWLSQAPSVSSPDLLPFIPFCRCFLLSLGILKVAPPWFCGESRTKVPSFLRSWNLIGAQVSIFNFTPGRGTVPSGTLPTSGFLLFFPSFCSLFPAAQEGIFLLSY